MKKNTSFILIPLIQSIIFLSLYNYSRINQRYDMVNQIIIPIVVSVISSVLILLISSQVNKKLSPNEKYSKARKKVSRTFPQHENISQYIKKTAYLQMINADELPIKDLIYISDIYIRILRREGNPDELQEAYKFMSIFLNLCMRRIKIIEKAKIVILSGGDEKFTDILFDQAFKTMTQQEVDEENTLKKYQEYLLRIRISEVREHFYKSLSLNYKNQPMYFLKLSNRKFKHIIKNESQHFEKTRYSKN